MRIRMLVAQAGPHVSRKPGKIYDLPDVAEARRLIESEQAEAIDPLPEVEVAPVETEAKADEESPTVETETATVEEVRPEPKTEPKPKATPKRGKKS
jgi:hypothetical protein